MLLHLGQNVITFRTLLHLGQNVITFRTLLHLGSFITFRPSPYAVNTKWKRSCLQDVARFAKDPVLRMTSVSLYNLL